ncbi:MAG: hypothetical protein RIT02_684, partial [Planctomycetota bacterium]
MVGVIVRLGWSLALPRWDFAIT